MAIWDQYDKTLTAAFARTCQRTPNKACMIFNGQPLHWGELDQYSHRIAHYLISQGVGHGDRVGVMCTTRPEYIVIYMACVKIGAILVGFNVQFKPWDVSRLAQKTQPKVYFILRKDRERNVLDEIRPALRELGHGAAVVAIEPSDTPFTGEFSVILGVQLTADAREAIAAAQERISEDDGLLIVFTSGSTGVPKAILLTHRNVLTNIAVQIRSFQMGEADRIMVHLPLNHVGAATVLVGAVVMLGATMVLLERFQPRATLDAIRRHRITVLHQVPTMYIMEFGLEDFSSFDLSSLRVCCVSGAVTPPEIMRKMMQTAPLVVTGYGMTEMAGFITYTEPDDDADAICNTVGKVAPEFDLRIVDDKKTTIAQGGIGEVALRGVCRFKEYYGDPAETAEVVDADGWYYTGDIGYLDPRWYLRLVDRKKMMYKTGGYNVYPREIEDAVMSLPGIDMCACLGAPDPVHGEVGALFVTLKPGAALSVADIERHCRNHLAEYKIPRTIVVKEAMPLTPLGKIDKQALKSIVQE
jgi:acyl-CoA synthetase (AMP-forming)/AMP-acid ligase II